MRSAENSSRGHAHGVSVLCPVQRSERSDAVSREHHGREASCLSAISHQRRSERSDAVGITTYCRADEKNPLSLRTFPRKRGSECPC